MNEDILVSVCVIAFNHGQYISKTLDKILSQDVNFRYEIIVHDDASTDNTKEILDNYYSKYPDIIVPFIEEVNTYSKGQKVIPVFRKKARGKYLAFCEGDDYWCDNAKLQKQIDVLEKEDSIIACVHNTKIFDCKFNKMCGVLNEVDRDYTVLTTRRILNWELQYSYHLSSLVVRKEIINSIPEYYDKTPVEDFAFALLVSLKGKILYLPEVMSVYRRFANNSWTSSNSASDKVFIRNYIGIKNMLSEFNKFTNNKFGIMIFVKKGYYNDSIIRKILNSKDDRKFWIKIGYHYVNIRERIRRVLLLKLSAK